MQKEEELVGEHNKGITRMQVGMWVEKFKSHGGREGSPRARLWDLQGD